jgi:hypothetical protein
LIFFFISVHDIYALLVLSYYATPSQSDEKVFPVGDAEYVATRILAEAILY